MTTDPGITARSILHRAIRKRSWPYGIAFIEWLQELRPRDGCPLKQIPPYIK